MTNRQAAVNIIRRLRAKGFQAVLAGGCVRDLLLRRTPKDYDVATDAAPRQVTKLFRRTRRVGAKFGVVIVLVHRRQVEVATFRTESAYSDGRHPDKVQFTEPRKDAARRDFTINGMFFDPLTKKVTDYVNGRDDLKKQIVRTIGNPQDRFSEDYLRMLRAVRFCTQLGFDIEPETYSAICQNAHRITKISGERIRMELEGILVHPNRARGASVLFDSGLAQSIFSPFDDQQSHKAVQVLSKLRRRTDFILGLAGLFAGCQTKIALDVCRILKLSRNENKHLTFLLTNRGILLDDKISLAKLKTLLSQPYFRDLYELQRAMQKADATNRQGLGAMIRLRRRIRALADVELQPKPLLNGHDLMRIGARPGPTLGQLAEEMYIAQLEGVLTTARQAETWVRDWLKKHKTDE